MLPDQIVDVHLAVLGHPIFPRLVERQEVGFLNNYNVVGVFRRKLSLAP